LHSSSISERQTEVCVIPFAAVYSKRSVRELAFQGQSGKVLHGCDRFPRFTGHG
jgi:hypothetical protein